MTDDQRARFRLGCGHWSLVLTGTEAAAMSAAETTKCVKCGSVVSVGYRRTLKPTARLPKDRVDPVARDASAVARQREPNHASRSHVVS